MQSSRVVISCLIFALVSLAAPRAYAGDTILIPSKTWGKYCPTWTAGDREFDGHGPRVVGYVWLEASPDGRQLRLNGDFEWEETQSNWTRANLYPDTSPFPIVLATAPAGRVLDAVWNGSQWVGLTSPTLFASIDYTDTDHALDIFSPAGAFWLNALQVMADTVGNDVGNCTTDDAYLKIILNAITVRYHLVTVPAAR